MNKILTFGRFPVIDQPLSAAHVLCNHPIPRMNEGFQRLPLRDIPMASDALQGPGTIGGHSNLKPRLIGFKPIEVPQPE
jgi:hypothetical protein